MSNEGPPEESDSPLLNYDKLYITCANQMRERIRLAFNEKLIATPRNPMVLVRMAVTGIDDGISSIARMAIREFNSQRAQDSTLPKDLPKPEDVIIPKAKEILQTVLDDFLPENFTKPAFWQDSDKYYDQPHAEVLARFREDLTRVCNDVMLAAAKQVTSFDEYTAVQSLEKERASTISFNQSSLHERMYMTRALRETVQSLAEHEMVHPPYWVSIIIEQTDPRTDEQTHYVELTPSPAVHNARLIFAACKQLLGEAGRIRKDRSELRPEQLDSSNATIVFALEALRQHYDPNPFEDEYMQGIIRNYAKTDTIVERIADLRAAVSDNNDGASLLQAGTSIRDAYAQTASHSSYDPLSTQQALLQLITPICEQYQHIAEEVEELEGHINERVFSTSITIQEIDPDNAEGLEQRAKHFSEPLTPYESHEFFDMVQALEDKLESEDSELLATYPYLKSMASCKVALDTLREHLDPYSSARNAYVIDRTIIEAGIVAQSLSNADSGTDELIANMLVALQDILGEATSHDDTLDELLSKLYWIRDGVDRNDFCIEHKLSIEGFENLGSTLQTYIEQAADIVRYVNTQTQSIQHQTAPEAVQAISTVGLDFYGTVYEVGDKLLAKNPSAPIDAARYPALADMIKSYHPGQDSGIRITFAKKESRDNTETYHALVHRYDTAHVLKLHLINILKQGSKVISTSEGSPADISYQNQLEEIATLLQEWQSYLNQHPNESEDWLVASKSILQDEANEANEATFSTYKNIPVRELLPTLQADIHEMSLLFARDLQEKPITGEEMESCLQALDVTQHLLQHMQDQQGVEIEYQLSFQQCGPGSVLHNLVSPTKGLVIKNMYDLEEVLRTYQDASSQLGSYQRAELALRKGLTGLRRDT